MAQIVVRKLEDEVKEGLRRRAARHGRSLEAEVREILRDAAVAEPGEDDDIVEDRPWNLAHPAVRRDRTESTEKKSRRFEAIGEFAFLKFDE